MTVTLPDAAPTATAARARVDRIKVGVEAVWSLIIESYQSRDWLQLGYATWDDMCTREFGTSRLRLPREERAETVQSLRDAGLSVRAIASVTGDSKSTVADITSSVQNRTVGMDTTTGVNGKTYQREPRTRDLSRANVISKLPSRQSLTPRREVFTPIKTARNALDRIDKIARGGLRPMDRQNVANEIRNQLPHVLKIAQQLLDDLASGDLLPGALDDFDAMVRS